MMWGTVRAMWKQARGKFFFLLYRQRTTYPSFLSYRISYGFSFRRSQVAISSSFQHCFLTPPPPPYSGKIAFLQHYWCYCCFFRHQQKIGMTLLIALYENTWNWWCPFLCCVRTWQRRVRLLFEKRSTFDPALLQKFLCTAVKNCFPALLLHPSRGIVNTTSTASVQRAFTNQRILPGAKKLDMTTTALGEIRTLLFHHSPSSNFIVDKLNTKAELKCNVLWLTALR